MAELHLVTGEYPPTPGGVADYTRLVAAALAARGETVHVWSGGTDGDPPADPGVQVHTEMGRFAPRDLKLAGQRMDQLPGPRRIVVQWVPHAYGYQSLNVPFCHWVLQRARRGDTVDLMVHEACLAFREGSWRQDAAAAVHRLMVVMLLQAARRVWVSIPAWERRLRPYTLGRRVRFQWLPVPSNVPVVDDPEGVAAARSRFARPGQVVVGHFGTYGRITTELLGPLLPRLADGEADAVLLLLGRGGAEYRDALVAEHPRLRGRIHATGGLAAREASLHLSACDLMVQPYPDGVSARRGSVMAALSHGRAVVAIRGHRTETVWTESGGVALVEGTDVGELERVTRDLIRDAAGRARLGEAARRLYDRRFALDNTVDAMQGA